MNRSRGCGNSGRVCSTSNECGAALSNSQMDEFGQSINAQSSQIQDPPTDQDESYSPTMSSGRGTRVIKRIKITRTSPDPDDPELQNDSLFLDNSGGASPNSHGSSGPDTYNSFQGYNQSSLMQRTIPAMSKNRHAKNYDDRSAPALIRTERGNATPTGGPSFPSTPLPDSPYQTSFGQHTAFNNSDNRHYDPNRMSPRSAYSGFSEPYSFGAEAIPAASGRSFEPARVPRPDPRMGNQSAPGAINTSLLSRGGRYPRGNESAPGAYGRSYSPVGAPDPRLANQTAPGGFNASVLSHSGRGVSKNSTCRNNRCGGSSGYAAADSSGGSGQDSSLWSPPRPVNTSGKYAAAIPWSPRQIPNLSDPVSTSSASGAYYTTEGSASDKSHGASVAWSPRQAGQFSYSEPSTDRTYYTTDGSGRSHGSSFPFTPRPLGHVSGYTDNSNRVDNNALQVSSGGCNSSCYRTPPRYTYSPLQTMSSQGSSRYYTDMSGGTPPSEHVNQSMQRSMNRPNTTGRMRNIPRQSRDYFSLIEDGTISPTTKKKKVVRQSTSAGSMVSEECEEVYDIPDAVADTSNESSSFNPAFTSSPHYQSGAATSMDPAMRSAPYYVGRGDRPPPRGDQSSTINDSFFGTPSPTCSPGKKGPCGCKKKERLKEDSPNSSGHKCDDIGTPCKEKKSHSSNISGTGGTPTDEPVNVFQAGKYDMSTEASATHSVAPVSMSKDCICKGASGNLGLDLERIEQEEFTQLSRNLAQWQQSRRKVVSKIDSLNGSKMDASTCEAECSFSKKHHTF